MSDGMFNGRVGLIVEVAPNQFHQYVLKEVDATLAIEREPIDHIGDLLGPFAMGPSYMTVHMYGRLVDQAEAARPDWMSEAAGQIEARREIEQRP